MKDELEAHLVAKGYPYEIVPVRSVGDLPPEQAARRRRPGRRTTSPLRTKEGLLAALKELEEPSKK